MSSGGEEDMLRVVATFALDDSGFAPGHVGANREFAPHAAHLMMQILGDVRVYRWGLLWTIS